jgi:Transposase DDE domain
MQKRKDSRKTAKKTAKKNKQPPLNGETLRNAMTWALDAKIFAHLKLHGNTSWQPLDLIVLAVVWVWSGEATLTGAFAEAHHWSMKVLGRAAVSTYQGLLKALVTNTAAWLPVIHNHLHQLMQEHGGVHWREGRWLPLAVDGSRVSTPRTKENEKAFCAPNFGKSNSAKYRKKKKKGKRVRRKAKESQPVKPQVWVTLLWHMGLRMPWSWKTGPSHSSEREHFKQMLTEQKFPENTLFCADAGFTGYDLWKQMLDAGHSFLIRVGANVTLLRKLGYVREKQGIVYFWPDKAACKGQPPLVLRLLHLQVGRCTMHLVTNVLDEKELSDQQAIRMYQLRWGVEIQFRTVKQTFGRRKLRSRTPDRAYVELDWSLLGLWMIQLFAVKEQIKIGDIPEHCSVSLAIQVIRETIDRWLERPEETFTGKLEQATTDGYKRKKSKKARYHPDYKDKPKAGKPKVNLATKKHKAWLEQHLNAAA